MSKDARERPGALTDEQYWSKVWSSPEFRAASENTRATGYLSQEFDKFFQQALSGRTGTLLEVGCASSGWMPYFATKFGLRVSGIDYSEVGCRQSETVLRDAGVPGEVFCRDAFAANDDLIERFDVVVSLGLVEHFDDTANAVRSLARYVKPGGLLISTSPNLKGFVGRAQRFLNRPVYEGHVPFHLQHLAEAHRAAGMVIQHASYIGAMDFHIVNLHGVESRPKWLVHRVLMRLSRIGWALPLSLPRNSWLSSALAVSAAKPA